MTWRDFHPPAAATSGGGRSRRSPAVGWRQDLYTTTADYNAVRTANRDALEGAVDAMINDDPATFAHQYFTYLDTSYDIVVLRTTLDLIAIDFVINDCFRGDGGGMQA